MIYWILGGGLLALWLATAAISIAGSRRVATLADMPSDGPEPLPKISIVVPALNEEATIEAAMRTLVTVDYPDFEIIAVDDRSTDSTGSILDRLAKEESRLRVVKVEELPPGWLGKNHALHVGSEAASGKWILFTDADVHLRPDTLRKAIRYAESRQLDHLTAYPHVIFVDFWEILFVLFFGAVFSLKFRPWDASNPRSRHYMGIGAFNLVRTSAYRAMGGHASLPMDITDDMKLGKRMKESGGRQECVTGYHLVRIRWIVGLHGAIHGLEKNAFAGTNFNPIEMALGCISLLLIFCWPFAGLFFGPVGPRLLCAATMIILMILVRSISPPPKVSPLYAFAFPLGAVLLDYIMLRSMLLTYRQGGVEWRGTLYPLKDLRKGIV